MLGRDQSENDELVARDVSERFEGAGALVVIFKQEALCSHVAEQSSADRFVAALGEPPAALVAASYVKAEGYTGKSIHDGIVQLETLAEPSIETPALRFIEASRLGIEQKTIVRRIKLDVARS